MSDIADALNRLNELGRPDLAEPIHFLMGERDGLMKALSAAKTVIESKDKAYSLIQQRQDAMAAKAATVDSERECNERLTAEIDTLSAQLSEAHAFLDAMTSESVAHAREARELAARLSEAQARILNTERLQRDSYLRAVKAEKERDEAQARLAEVRDALPFTIRGDDPPVIDWSAKGGSGCRPATEAEFEMWRILTDNVATAAQAMCGCGDTFGEGSVCANCLCGKYVEAGQAVADDVVRVPESWLTSLAYASAVTSGFVASDLRALLDMLSAKAKGE